MSDLPTDKTTRTLAARSVSDVLRSCAAPLGVPVGYLESSRVRSVSRTADDDNVVRTFTRGPVALVSLPNAARCEFELDDASLRELIALTEGDASAGRVVLQGVQLEIDGDPAPVFAADALTLDDPRPHARAMLVYDPSPVAMSMLRHDVSADEWSRGGGDMPAMHRVGALAGGVLVALASIEEPRDHIARARVVVSPGQRRRGLGRLALATLASNVVKRGLIPYAHIAHDADAERALARSVGFVPFARTLTLRVSTVGDAMPSMPVNAQG